MSDWRKGNLGELVTGIRGVSYTPDQLRECKSPGTVTLLRSNNIQSGWLQFKNIQIVQKDVVSAVQILRPGDIAVCMSNGSKALVGKAAPFVNVTTEKFTVGAFCSIFRPATGADPDFTKFFFQSSAYRAQLDISLAGSAINNLRNSDLELFSIQIPPSNHQQKIAAVLNALDVAIQQTESIVDKLKQVMQGLLHDLLTRGIDSNGELRPPQSQAPHLYMDSPVGQIPIGWHVQRMADFMAADITYGIVQAGPHIEGGVPYIRTGDMSGERLVKHSMQCTTQRISNAFRRSEVRAGDIVMAIRATVGKVLVVPDELDGANLTQGTARLAPNEQTDSVFLLWAIRQQRAQNSIQSEIKGTTFAEITLAALREVPLAAPCRKDEQMEIGKRMTACEDRVFQEVRTLGKLNLKKSGLMNDLLTGRVRVTSLLDTMDA